MPYKKPSGSIIEARWGTSGLSRKTLTLFLQASLERVLMLNALKGAYSEIQKRSDCSNFFQGFLEYLNVRPVIGENELKKIPREGPLVIVCNHPFGGLDGLIIGAIFTQVRHDVRILGNYLLENIPELRSLVISVDPF